MRLLFITATFSTLASCSSALETPEEVGKVTWNRDLPLSLQQSRETNKPIFALFQEVPGCAGCKQFGREVLSNPLIVDAIEEQFIPLLVHNNQPGKDAKILKQFGEPAWNYQVVRFLDKNSKDIIPRKDRVWDTGSLAKRMILTLQKQKKETPPYLQLLASEHSGQLKQAAFAMHCFWTGEMKLGSFDGVISTEAGWIGGKEVTKVLYDPTSISTEDLISKAKKIDCAHTVFLPTEDLQSARKLAPQLDIEVLEKYRKARTSDQKKQIQNTIVAKLNLTQSQATKVNAWIRRDKKRAFQFLSARQLAEVIP